MCSADTDCYSGLECASIGNSKYCKASLASYTCSQDSDCAPGLGCGSDKLCYHELNTECSHNSDCMGDLQCSQNRCRVPANGDCSSSSDCVHDHGCSGGKCLAADWVVGTWNGNVVYGVKTCSSGDWNCQAKSACEQATGASCAYQSYSCSSYPNGNGSYYPTSNPLGRSVSTSGTSSLNWAVTSSLTTNSNSNYGNLCCCSCSGSNGVHWNSGLNGCGYGSWQPY